jgi:radical SAM superfamily enzyme YgiQ (UPF0313 family)
LSALLEGGSFDNIRGVAFRKNGEIVLNKPRHPIEDLDEIPFPAREIFPLRDYEISFGTITGKTLPMITSRGCGNTCKFCSTTRYWTKVRFRSAKT